MSAERDALTQSTLEAVRPRTLRRNAIASVGRWAVTILVTAAVFPLMLSRLGADEVGLWVVLTTPTSMMGLAGLGVGPAGVVLIGGSIAAALEADARSEAETWLRRAAHLCAATMLLSAAAAGVTVALGWFATSPLLDLLDADRQGVDGRFLFRTAVICLGAMLFGGGLTAQLEGARRVDLYSLSWAVISTSNALFLLTAMLIAPGLRALAIVQLMTAAMNVAVPMVLLMRSRIILLWRWAAVDAGAITELGRKAVGLGGAGGLIAVADPLVKLTLGASVGTAPVAAYEIAQRVVRLAAGGLTSAMQALFAHVSGAAGEGRLLEVPAVIARAMRAVAAAAFPLLTVLALVAPAFTSLWLGDGAPDGTASSIAILCPAMALSLMGTAVYHALQGAGRAARVLTTQVANIVGIGIVLCLVPSGVIGAAYAGALAAACGMVLTAAVSAVHYAQVYGRPSARRWLRACTMGVVLAMCVAPVLVLLRTLDASDVSQVAVGAVAGFSAVAFGFTRGSR